MGTWASRENCKVQGLELYWDDGKKLERAIESWGHIGIMEKKMETTIAPYWDRTASLGCWARGL